MESKKFNKLVTITKRSRLICIENELVVTGGERVGKGYTEVGEWEAHRVRCKMSSRMYCTTWGRVPVLCINYKWKANVNSCIIRKKRKGRGGRKEGRKEGKHGVFGHHKANID